MDSIKKPIHFFLNRLLINGFLLDMVFFQLEGLKYDLRRVEEVYYDVKIRGLSSSRDSVEDQGLQGQQ